MPGSHPDAGLETAAASDTSVSDAAAPAPADTGTGTPAAVETPDTGAAPAHSPSAEGDRPKTLLEATRRALDVGKSPAPESATKDATAEAKPPGEAEGKGDADNKDPPFHQHPRWQEKQREVKQLREQVQGFQADATAHRE